MEAKIVVFKTIALIFVEMHFNLHFIKHAANTGDAAKLLVGIQKAEAHYANF